MSPESICQVLSNALVIVKDQPGSLFFGRRGNGYPGSGFLLYIGTPGQDETMQGLIRIFGPRITSFIDKYFNLLSILFVVILVAGFIIIKYFL